MASELLKRQALINKLKEPETANINFDLEDSALDYSIESIEEDILPEAKPVELFEERERVRTERLSDTLTKIGGGLMDESVDFIRREEFRTGTNQFGESLRKNPEIVAKIKKMFLEEKIPAQEIMKRLSISKPTLYRILKDEKIPTPETTQRNERFSKLKELVEEANNGEKFVTMKDLAKKAGIKSRDTFYYQNLKKFNIPKLENQRDKTKKVFNSIVNDPDTPIKELQDFSKAIADRTGLDRAGTNFFLNNLPEYKAFKPILNKIASAGFQKKAQGMTLGEVGKITEQVKQRVPAMTFTSPEKFIIQSAKRHVEKGGDKIKFVKKPGDLDAKGNRITDFDSEFIYKNKKYNYKQLLKEGKKIPAFKEVYKSFDDLNKLLSKKAIHPVTKEETTLKNVMEDAYGKGAGYGKGRSSYEIDHFKGVETEPFSDLRVLPRRINSAAGLIKEIEGQAKLGLLKTEDYTPEKAKSYIKKIGYDFTKDIDTLAKDELKLAEDILVRNRKLDTPIQIAKKAVLGKTEIPAAKKLSALQEIYSRAGMNLDPALAARAVKEELIDPLKSRVPPGKGIRALSTAGRIALPEAYFAPASIVLDTYAGRTPKEMALNVATLGFGAPAADAYRKAQVLKDLGFLSDYKKAMAKINRADQALAEEVETLGMDTPAEEFAAPEFTKNERLAALIGQVEDLKLKTRLEEKAADYQKLRENQLKKGLLEVTPDEEALPEDVGIKPEIPLEEEEEKSLGFFDRITGNIPRDFMSKGGIMATRLGFASGTGPFPLRLMFMIKDRLNNLKQSTFSNYNDVRMFGEQKGIENILTPYKNIPDKNKLMTALEDVEELKKIMPEEYQSILNDIANDTKQFNFKTANDRTKALVETLPSDIDFKKLSDDLFPMPNPENPSMILLGPDNPVSPSRFKTTTEIDTFTGKGKRTTRDYFDEETGEFVEEGKFVDEEPLDEEFSEMIRDMDKPDETN